MRRGTRELAVITGTLALLAGCTTDPADPPTTPATPATSVSPSPSPTPTPEPDPATIPPERPDLSAVDEATAEALAVYFLELYPYVYATGDLTEWRTLSHPECIYCASVIAEVEQMVAGGEHWEGGQTEVSVLVTAAVTSDFYDVTLEVSEGPARLLSSDGSVARETAGGANTIHVVATAEGGTWNVRGVDIEDQG